MKQTMSAAGFMTVQLEDFVVGVGGGVCVGCEDSLMALSLPVGLCCVQVGLDCCPVAVVILHYCE